jgi:hypothetical protein
MRIQGTLEWFKSRFIMYIAPVGGFIDGLYSGLVETEHIGKYQLGWGLDRCMLVMEARRDT